jgi:uncharacterized protein (TIGR03435 family)
MYGSLLAVFALCGLLLGQSFEVVTVKPGTQGTRKALKRAGKLRERIDDQRVDLGSQSLAFMIEMAWQVDEDQWSGPDWLDEARFDVQAKLPAGATRKDVPEMMRAMLTERFGLVLHHESRLVASYALRSGKGPVGMKRSAADSAGTGCDGGTVTGHHICSNMTMDDLAVFLTRTYRLTSAAPAEMAWGPDRPVFDATGLEGRWDFSMDYGIVSGQAMSIVAAVKALGLRLEPEKRTVDHLVIDHAERTPTEN